MSLLFRSLLQGNSTKAPVLSTFKWSVYVHLLRTFFRTMTEAGGKSACHVSSSSQCPGTALAHTTARGTQAVRARDPRAQQHGSLGLSSCLCLPGPGLGCRFQGLEGRDVQVHRRTPLPKSSALRTRRASEPQLAAQRPSQLRSKSSTDCSRLQLRLGFAVVKKSEATAKATSSSCHHVAVSVRTGPQNPPTLAFRGYFE